MPIPTPILMARRMKCYNWPSLWHSHVASWIIWLVVPSRSSVRVGKSRSTKVSCSRPGWLNTVGLFQSIKSGNAHNSPVKQLLLSMFYRQGICGETERLSTLNKVTRRVGNRAAIPLASVYLQRDSITWPPLLPSWVSPQSIYLRVMEPLKQITQTNIIWLHGYEDFKIQNRWT